MQIAFCIFKYFPYGGIQRDLLKLSLECRARGMSVRIYAIRWLAEPPGDMELCVLPATSLTRHGQYEQFAHRVRDDVERRPVDLVVGMNKMPGLDVYYAGDSCYREKARTQRNVFYRLLPRYRSFLRAERTVFEPDSGTEILTLSDVQAPVFRRHYGTPAQRFHALPPGIERDRAAPPDRQAVRCRMRAELGLDEKDRLLLFVGSGFVKKGLNRVLLGLRALPAELLNRTRLYVLGEDKPGRFERMARRLGVSEKVRFLGGRNDVPDFLLAGDGLVLPALDENAGMVILEAMIAGLPALVTKNCGYAAYLEEADAGLLTPVPFSQRVFDEQLVELLTSRERGRWACNGMAVAADENIYRMVPAAVDLFERFAGARRGPDR
ncbi:MAG: glycosyltransferase family 4 protein [Gammaproteobacteria bacterium]|nr:glycosyltransferase family 4 protein [Gammaproteobacteria bacterium]MDE0365068.1 glycosyltransferase family 4 protein [Gammaproteobacteria bacterium]